MVDFVVALVLGIALGMLVAYASYAHDLGRIASFLRRRERAGNARVTIGSGAPGLTALADAVNAELDASAEAHVAAARRDAEFRRDLSALSHDIRTPLMGAKGFLELAGDEADPAARDRLLVSARARLDDVRSLLDQLFVYAKASDPDLALRMGPVALQPLVADVLVGHYPEFEERGWEPEVTFADEGVCVEADVEQLRRIFENLVANALRHGMGAPSVRQVGDGETVTLTVSNPVTDPSAIDVSRLFERFYQADSARGANGAGLGLSTAAKLAQAMRMRISASLTGDELAIALAMPVVASSRRCA